MPRTPSFICDVAGNIAPLFAVLTIPIFFAAGSMVDYSMFINNRDKVVSAADAAIIGAAAKVGQEGNLEDREDTLERLTAEIEPFIRANLDVYEALNLNIENIDYNTDDYMVDLQVTFAHPTSFMQLAGINQLETTVNTAVQIGKAQETPFSMFLILDESGSMNSNGRMDALKTAVSEMSSQFELADPEHKFIRLGAVSYDNKTSAPIGFQWGSLHANAYTQNLVANGGTDSSGAMGIAHNSLSGNAEAEIHATKHDITPRKLIVFMTDGNNNRVISDTETIDHCDNAKSLENIEIYSVAFQAPARGQQLLANCASTSEHYFEADNASELIEIFKQIGFSATDSPVLTR